MDTIQNIRAFLTVCRCHSFVAAARELGVSPAVVTKRVNQLEWRLKARLLERTTRRVRTTELGNRYMALMQHIVRDYAELVAGTQRAPSALEGHIRIKTPVSLTEQVLTRVFIDFQRRHPAVTLEVIVLDRSINPVEENFDIVIDVMPSSFNDVMQETLLRYPAVVCASPEYLARRGHPARPEDLRQHDCLVFLPTGSTWGFISEKGPIVVNVQPCFTSNDAHLLLMMVCCGCGVGRLSSLLAQRALRAGELVPLLPEYPAGEVSLSAYVPESRIHLARVRALLHSIREAIAAMPPLYSAPFEGVRMSVDTAASLQS